MAFIAMDVYQHRQNQLIAQPKLWLITGVAGFIGSNLLEALLKLNQTVIGLDNFATGYLNNLHSVKQAVSTKQWQGFTFIEGDINNLETCQFIVNGVDYVLHQAALGSVPRSLANPLATHQTNITGQLNMLIASRDAGVKRFIYAASSSTYGDHSALPKVENIIGKPLSPYAVTKYVNELYADVFARCYGLQSIGLRYFNVFGPRQNVNGAYAAVIPTWYRDLLTQSPIYINGDGQSSRDFCFVNNVIQANILAATTTDNAALNQIYNVALNQRTCLNELFLLIRERVATYYPFAAAIQPQYRDFRAGDVQHSQANIDKIKHHLGYNPTHSVIDGLNVATPFYIQQCLCND